MRINILAGNKELKMITKFHDTIEECLESKEEVKKILLEGRVKFIGAWIDDSLRPAITTKQRIH